MSQTCKATFGVPGRGGEGRGGARESRKRGVATDARGLPAFQVLDEIAPPARQVGVNHGRLPDRKVIAPVAGMPDPHRIDIQTSAEPLRAP